MSNPIQQIDSATFALEARGSQMLLQKTAQGWRMTTTNASTRAWRRGVPSWKDFETLADVERHYKSWRGIAALVGATQPA